MTNQPRLTVEATVRAPLQKVWDCWTKPEHITQWNAASDDWHAPRATNDLRVGGAFTCRMEAKDGSFGFDFGGIYTQLEPLQTIAYTMGGDGRTVTVHFQQKGSETVVTEEFDPESENPLEMQKQGWQAILDNFKKYTEAQT